MAIFHLHASTGSRKGGQSAAAKSDYIKREGDYVKVTDAVLATGDGHMPAWASDDARVYWQAADDHERANGRLYKEIEFALPRELTLEQQVEAVEAFASHVTDELSLPFSYAIHEGKGSNPHCHLIVSERVNDGHERSAETWFKRAATGKRQSPEDGGARKTDALKPKAWLEQTREAWAGIANDALERHGHSQRIDHRSHADRALETIPTQHEGYGPRAEERRIENERIELLNDEIREMREQADAIAREIEQIEHEQDVLATIAAEDAASRALEDAQATHAAEAEQEAAAAEFAREHRQRQEAAAARAAKAAQQQPEPQADRPKMTKAEAFNRAAERMKARRLAREGGKEPTKAPQEPPQAPKAPDPLHHPSVQRLDRDIAAQAREAASARDAASDASSDLLDTQLDINRADRAHAEARQGEKLAAAAVATAQVKLESIGGWFKGKERKAATAELEQAQGRHDAALAEVQDTGNKRRRLAEQYDQQRKAAKAAEARAEAEKAALAKLQRQRTQMIDRLSQPADRGDQPDAWSREAAAAKANQGQQQPDAWSREATAKADDQGQPNAWATDRREQRDRGSDGPELG